jgi:hypothetical protein
MATGDSRQASKGSLGKFLFVGRASCFPKMCYLGTLLFISGTMILSQVRQRGANIAVTLPGGKIIVAQPR